MKRIFTACICFSLLSPLWALTPKMYVGGGLGGMAPMVDSNHFASAGQGWPLDQYISHKTIDKVPFLFINAGYTWPTLQRSIPYLSLGLRYTYASSFNIRGYINQYSLPAFQNYHYQYSVRQQNILAVLKADLYRWQGLMPYVLAGAGMSINNTSNYKEWPINGVAPRIPPGFRSNTNTAFAYIAGFGFDYILQDNLWVNLEYNYGHFGKIKTGNAVGLFSGTTLANKLSSNMLLLGATYYLG